MATVEQADWLGGWHVVQAVVRHQPHRLQRVLLIADKSSRQKQLLVQLQPFELVPEIVECAVLDRLVKGVVHQGVAALCTKVPEGTEAELFEHLKGLSDAPLLLLLDSVQDPRNLGAALRVAEAAGCHAVVLEKRNAAPLSQVAQKAASGAHPPIFRVPGLVRVIAKLQQRGLWIYGADAQSQSSLFMAELTGPIAWVMGGEENGLRPLVAKSCDYLASIPMAGMVASLNVSAAAAVCLFETYRQRH